MYNIGLPVKDKLAIIFGGIVGGDSGTNNTGNIIDFKSCAQTIIHNVISPNDADVFIHSWSVDQEKDLIDIYKPKKYSFEKQEMFGYNFTQEEGADIINGQGFRVTSRYVSVERGMNLKQEYENEQGFVYKWILIFRLDYVVLTQLTPNNLNALDANSIYVGYEPSWPNIAYTQKLYDGFFLGHYSAMDLFYYLGSQMKNGIYAQYIHDAHYLMYIILLQKFGSIDNIKYIYQRFKDFEAWRLINKPELNPLGIQYGVLDTKDRYEILIKSLTKSAELE